MAADDAHPPGLVYLRHIARDKPTIPEAFRGFLRLPPVAREHVGAADFQNPHGTLGHRRAFFRPEAHFPLRKREAHGAGDARSLEGVGGNHPRLGHAVALKNLVPRAGLEGLVGFRPQGGGAGHPETHARRGLDREPRRIQEPHIMGGHAHEHRRPGEGLEHRLGAKAWQKAHLRGLEHGAVQGHKQAVDVIDGQAVHEHVIGLPAPERPERLGVGQ